MICISLNQIDLLIHLCSLFCFSRSEKLSYPPQFLQISSRLNTNFSELGIYISDEKFSHRSDLSAFSLVCFYIMNNSPCPLHHTLIPTIAHPSTFTLPSITHKSTASKNVINILLLFILNLQLRLHPSLPIPRPISISISSFVPFHTLYPTPLPFL